MPRLTRSIEIRASADRVWRVLVDPMQAPDWEAGLAAVEDVGGTLDEPAASCTQVMNFRGRTLQGQFEVLEAFPPHTRAVQMQPPLTREALRRERLVDVDDGTQVTFELSYSMRGGPLGPLLNVAFIRPRLAIMLAESLRNLRGLVESEQL